MKGFNNDIKFYIIDNKYTFDVNLSKNYNNVQIFSLISISPA